MDIGSQMADTTQDLFQGQERSNWIRLRTLILLRWVAIIGQLGAITVAQHTYGVQLDVTLCYLAIGVSVMGNLTAILLFPRNKRLSEFENEPERWVDLHWHSGTHPAVYGATLDLTIGNDAGVLGRICTLIGEKKANISNLEFVDRKPDFYRLLINVELRDLEQLHSLMLMLEAESDVAAVERHRDKADAAVAAG